MSFHAANPAGFSDLSLCLVELTNKSLSTRNYRGDLRPSYGGHAGSNRMEIAVNPLGLTIVRFRADQAFS